MDNEDMMDAFAKLNRQNNPPRKANRKELAVIQARERRAQREALALTQQITKETERTILDDIVNRTQPSYIEVMLMKAAMEVMRGGLGEMADWLLEMDGRNNYGLLQLKPGMDSSNEVRLDEASMNDIIEDTMFQRRVNPYKTDNIYRRRGRPLQHNLTRTKIGTLFVSHINSRDGHGNALWLCQCDCGLNIHKRTEVLMSNRVQWCDQPEHAERLAQLNAAKEAEAKAASTTEGVTQ